MNYRIDILKTFPGEVEHIPRKSRHSYPQSNKSHLILQLPTYNTPERNLFSVDYQKELYISKK